MKLVRAKNIKSFYSKLKQSRVKADYQIEKVTVDEIKSIQNFVKEFDDCYQIIKNEL
ncbi:hypothetical protein [Staphylococcus cornubiensis]|uniref:hypothetical protein n=1 Tax=Staphylococcus cornubiensis TaxID=1986155 RepID=UPI0013566341|nr:hypothetical protein [Staphylococcus cornubiensis]